MKLYIWFVGSIVRLDYFCIIFYLITVIEVLRTGLNSNKDLMVALLILSGLVYYIDYSLKILGLEIYKV